MRVLIIGAFDFKKMDIGGQLVKTRELYNLLKKQSYFEFVDYLETFKWKKRFVFKFFELLAKTRKNDIIIMLPAQNGVNVFSKLLLLFKKKKTRVYYYVIGGWLPEILINNNKLSNRLMKFNGIWVETTNMCNSLKSIKFNNVYVIPNFKNIKPLKVNDMITKYEAPYKLCTFSRVMVEKGIEDAINAIKKINSDNNKVILTLDIYGAIDENYLKSFNLLMKSFPKYIQYKGIINPSESINTIKNYFLLLFPTHYYTEGIPGTIIDSYASGVPIITSLWKNYNDVFMNGITGYGYSFDDKEGLINAILNAINDVENVVNMKKNCLKYSEKFTTEAVEKEIKDLLMNGDN